nr:mechanosensitive ion channel domain-containing protein [Romboutsia sp. 13368]
MSALLEKLIEWTATTGFKLIIGALIISIGFKLINKFVGRFIYVLEKKDVDITLSKFLKSLITVGLKIILVLPVLGYWGIELSGIAALVASAGVAIGLALQGSLSNFAGGFIILFIRPFKVGDYIETATYGGTVEQIGLFYTQLVTIDNKQILIPNGTLSNGSLINYSAKPTRRVDLIFSVGYENDITHVKEVLNKIVERNKLILKDPAPFVAVSAHSASSVDFIVRAWCNTENYWSIYYDLLEEVKITFDKENISIPYPQMDLHLKEALKK